VRARDGCYACARGTTGGAAGRRRVRRRDERDGGVCVDDERRCGFRAHYCCYYCCRVCQRVGARWWVCCGELFTADVRAGDNERTSGERRGGVACGDDDHSRGEWRVEYASSGVLLYCSVRVIRMRVGDVVCRDDSIVSKVVDGVVVERDIDVDSWTLGWRRE